MKNRISISDFASVQSIPFLAAKRRKEAQEIEKSQNNGFILALFAPLCGNFLRKSDRSERLSNFKYNISYFNFVIGLLLLTSACGRQVSTAAAAAPTRAFVASDFENNADPDSEEIEVPIVARDPFQTPGSLRAEEHTDHLSHVATARRAPVVAEHFEPLAPEPPPAVTAQTSYVQAIEEPQAQPETLDVTWPGVRLSGMLRDANGRWMAAIDGNVIRVGEWITPDVRLDRADQNGAVFIHRSGALRRINVIDGRIH